MAQVSTFHISGSDTGKPLVDFIAGRLDISKKKAKQLLDDRVVFVNRQRVWMARHPLVRGDIVEVQAPPKPPPAAALRILYRDGDYVAIDKPPGLLSNGPKSAEAQLREQLASDDIEAVHRIDRDTSGCLLLATRAKSRDAAIALFKERELGKIYRALVFGSFPQNLRVIDEPIEGKPARTLVRVLAHGREASHLELTIETGRTHQIRKHLAHAGHPVLGDKVYAIGQVPSERLRGVPRQMLHAYEMEFIQPLTQAPLHIRAPLPDDFQKLAAKLKLL